MGITISGSEESIPVEGLTKALGSSGLFAGLLLLSLRASFKVLLMYSPCS